MLSFILLVASACTAQKKVTNTYSEDLSARRYKFAIVEDTSKVHVEKEPQKNEVMHPTKNVNAKVDEVLDSIGRFNLTRRFVDGYTAQIYSGAKREDAMNSKLKLTQEIPEMVADIQYIQPKFRVTVGHYFSRLEAQKDLVRLKHIFPNVILIPDKIQIK